MIFFVFAALALAGALGVVLARNPVHSALSLVVTLVSVAVLFAQQDAHLLAAVQVIVYAGAIVVLFLFVIMLLGVDQPEVAARPAPLPADRRPSSSASSLLAEVLFLAGHQWATGAHGRPPTPSAAARPVSATTSSGSRASLFTDFLWPFEITAVLLVLAVVGAVVLARRSRQRRATTSRRARTSS